MGGIWVVCDLDAKKRGSFEQQQVALATRLRERGVPLTYVFARPPAPFPGDAIRALGVDVRDLDPRAPGSARVLARWLLEARPRIVHFNFVRAFSPFVLAARMSGAQVICHDRIVLMPFSGSHASAREAVKMVRARTLGWMFDRRIAVSPAVADSIARQDLVPRHKISLVPNGIDVDRFANARGDALRSELGLGGEPLLCTVARLDDEKGVESAVRALPLIRRGAHLALAGEGPLREKLLRMVGEMGVGDRLHLLGLRNDVEKVLAAANVVVQPTHGIEAFGFVVAEALAAGKSLVVTDSGGMPWVAGEAGFVVPRRDPQALAAAINRLLEEELLARRLGVQARERAVREFSLERWVDRITAIYDQVRKPLPRPLRRAA